MYVCMYVYIFRWGCPHCCLGTVKNKVWMTSDCLASSGAKFAYIPYIRKVCMPDQILTAIRFININWIQNYLSRIFSFSSRNLFCERLHWRNYTFCGRGKIIFRGNRTRQRFTHVAHFVATEIDFQPQTSLWNLEKTMLIKIVAMFRNLLISSFDATIRVKRAFHPAPASRGFASHIFLVCSLFSFMSVNSHNWLSVNWKCINIIY